MNDKPRSDRRTRICIWVILIGLLNFLAYATLYLWFDGEAINGSVVPDADGSLSYFLRSPRDEAVPVSLAVYLYSGIHSISIWLTVGAVMLSMLTLAKDRIVSSMHSAVVRGRTFITVLATIITLIVIAMTILFTLRFASRFAHPRAASQLGPQVTTTRSWP